MDDEVQCPCCRIFYGPTPRAFPPYANPENSPLHPRMGVCKECCDHQGEGESLAVIRGKLHGRMLRRAYELGRRRVAEAQQQVVEMQRELNMRPVQTVIRVENLDKIVLTEAIRDRVEAYRRRDVAMGALSDVRLFHHRDRERRKRCACGMVYRECEMAQIVDRWEGVTSWERSQAGQAFRGERHHLRGDHPALNDATYMRDVYGA